MENTLLEPNQCAYRMVKGQRRALARNSAIPSRNEFFSRFDRFDSRFDRFENEDLVEFVDRTYGANGNISPGLLHTNADAAALATMVNRTTMFGIPVSIIFYGKDGAKFKLVCENPGTGKKSARASAASMVGTWGSLVKSAAAPEPSPELTIPGQVLEIRGEIAVLEMEFPDDQKYTAHVSINTLAADVREAGKFIVGRFYTNQEQSIIKFEGSRGSPLTEADYHRVANETDAVFEDCQFPA